MQCELLIISKINKIITMRDIKEFIFHLRERSLHWVKCTRKHQKLFCCSEFF